MSEKLVVCCSKLKLPSMTKTSFNWQWSVGLKESAGCHQQSNEKRCQADEWCAPYIYIRKIKVAPKWTLEAHHTEQVVYIMLTSVIPAVALWLYRNWSVRNTCYLYRSLSIWTPLWAFWFHCSDHETLNIWCWPRKANSNDGFSGFSRICTVFLTWIFLQVSCTAFKRWKPVSPVKLSPAVI